MPAARDAADDASAPVAPVAPVLRTTRLSNLPSFALLAAMGLLAVVVWRWQPAPAGATSSGLAATARATAMRGLASANVAMARVVGLAAAAGAVAKDGDRADASDDAPLATADALDEAAAVDAQQFDAQILRIYAAFARGQADAAVDAARRLTVATPASGLAQLVYADLLRLRAGAPPLSGWGATAFVPGDAVGRLAELQAEVRARLKAAHLRPPPGTLPVQFLRLPPAVGHAIAVDVSRSRVYALSYGNGRWSVVHDYYASVGKLGASKQTAGDLRTPLGIYFVTGTVPKGHLADRFGAAALTLNYPNQYDQWRGRTGSGIWLHGVPTAMFARAPLATDGCVAMANPDLIDLARFVDRQTTPVLIAPHLQWVAADEQGATAAGTSFLTTFDAWRAAHAERDAAAELRYYSAAVRTPAAASGPSWEALVHGERTAAGWSPVLGDVSMVGWNDDRSVMVVTFKERDTPSTPARLKRQYWLEDGGRWQIVYEGAVG